MNPRLMRIAFIIFFASLTFLFAFITWPFAKSAFLAFTLTIVFSPLYHRILRRFKMHRYLASFATTIIIAACFILPLAILGTVVITKIGAFLQDFVLQLEQGTFANIIEPLFHGIHSWIVDLIGQAPLAQDFETAILETFKAIATQLYQFSPRVLSTTISVVTNFFLMFLFLIVFFVEGDALYRWFVETTPLSRSHWEEMATEVRTTITTSLTASIVTAIVQGSLLGIGFVIAGFHQPYGWWLVAILASIVPIVGAASCYVIACIVLLAAGETAWAIGFLLYGIGIVSSVDNVIRPLIVRGASKMHPLLLFVTFIGAVRFFGPIGIVVGPVLLAIFLSSLRIYRREFAQLADK
ncbi:MAG: AI-2E family transporter [Deltaproteobacteria bacterium]|nr:AI-2E family transporter [Deltaproteobacteria bacterium]